MASICPIDVGLCSTEGFINSYSLGEWIVNAPFYMLDELTILTTWSLSFKLYIASNSIYVFLFDLLGFNLVLLGYLGNRPCNSSFSWESSSTSIYRDIRLFVVFEAKFDYFAVFEVCYDFLVDWPISLFFLWILTLIPCSPIVLYYYRASNFSLIDSGDGSETFYLDGDDYSELFKVLSYGDTIGGDRYSLEWF